jgi:hypothetical protein
MAIILGRIASAGMAADNLQKMMGKTKADIQGPLDRCALLKGLSPPRSRRAASDAFTLVFVAIIDPQTFTHL